MTARGEIWAAMRRNARDFWSSEDGSGSVEFVLLAPFVVSMFASGVELGLLKTQQTMLDRSLDIVMRDVRMGVYSGRGDGNTLHNIIRDAVCVGSLVVNCRNRLRVEMGSVPLFPDPADPRTFSDTPTCADREIEPTEVTRASIGAANQLMMVRVCALYRPLFPTNALSQRIQWNGQEFYALVSTSAFVVEPGG